MDDFEAPSFSLGLDCDLLNTEPQISSSSQYRDSSSLNQFSVAAATIIDNDDNFETLIVDDSEPEYPDPHPKLKRLRRRLTMNATSSSVSANAKVELELHSTATVDDEDIDVFSSHEDRHTGKRMQNVPELSVSPLRRFQLIDSNSDSDDPSVSDNGNNRKCNVSTSCSNRGQSDHPQHVGLSNQRKVIESVDMDEVCEEVIRPMKHESNAARSCLDLNDSLPPAHQYFFHDDPRIQELVQSRLPNFSPLGNVSYRDLEQPSTSKIDYMGQFSCGDRSKQTASNNIKDKKGSTSRKISRKSKIEEMSQGWVNPKLGVNKATTKGSVKRKVHVDHQTSGHWLTGSDGKKVYVGKNGQELTGRVAYMQFKKEKGAGFKKGKRKSCTKKKKK